MRELVWQQCHAVLLLPSERQWRRYIGQRLAAFGMIINANPHRLPRYRELDDECG
jgi:hypothetical protein